MAKKGLWKGLPENLPELEESFRIYLLNKETKIPWYPTPDVSKYSPGFMLKMDFVSFNVESIRGFTSIVLDICSATSYLFGFTSRIKCPPLEILQFLVTKLKNQDNKVALIRAYEYGALARSSEFMNTYHNTNIIVHTTYVDASSINGKIESPSKTLANITRAFILNSSHKKKLLCVCLSVCHMSLLPN